MPWITNFILTEKNGAIIITVEKAMMKTAIMDWTSQREETQAEISLRAHL